MSVADELQNLNDNILAAYTTIGNKGGTVPTDKNTDNLATAIGSIPNGGGGSEPGGNIKITAYDTATGVISGGGFGSTAGTVYVLDRDTNTYVPQTVASWTPSSITLDTPVDLTTLEGTTSMAVVADDGTWSNKWLLTGDVAVSGWGKLYIKDSDTGTVYTESLDSNSFGQVYNVTSGWATLKTIQGRSFYADEIVGMQFGSDFNLTSLGDFFLAYCANITQPLTIPSGVTSIGNNFMAYCITFNQTLSLPSTITNIGNGFLTQCIVFNQPITIPSAVTSIGNYFIYQCYAFNQPITIPSSVTSIGSNFLGIDYAFNQPITIPSGVTSIGERFLGSCQAFNQPVTILNGLQAISNSFLASCNTFNQPITIPSSVTSIGQGFLQMCYSFAQPLTIPSTVTTLSGASNFLYRCNAFTDLTVNTSSIPPTGSSTNVLCTDSSSSAKMYRKGITVKGTGRSSWISAFPNSNSSPYRKLIDGGE